MRRFTESASHVRFFLGPCLSFQGNSELVLDGDDDSPLSSDVAERDSDEEEAEAEKDRESSSVASSSADSTEFILVLRAAGQYLGSGLDGSLLYPNTQFITAPMQMGIDYHSTLELSIVCFLLERSLVGDYMSEIVFPFRAGATTAPPPSAISGRRRSRSLAAVL